MKLVTEIDDHDDSQLADAIFTPPQSIITMPRSVIPHNLTPIISTPRTDTTETCKDSTIPVLFKIKHIPNADTKKLCMCLLNVRSIGDDIKSGKIRDMIVNEEPAIDCAIFT